MLIGIISKDSIVPDEAKLIGSSNFHLKKYMITQIAKKEKLWSILSGSHATSSKKPVDLANPETTNPKTSEESEDERVETSHVHYEHINKTILISTTYRISGTEGPVELLVSLF